MSVIAIRAYDHHVDIAVDSAVSYGESTLQRGVHFTDSKLWVIGDTAIAFVGTSSLAAVLRRFSRSNALQDASEDAVMDYVDGFHALKREHFPEGDYDDVSWAVVKDGRAWVVDGYSASMVSPGSYFAHGSGMDLAIGALHHGGNVDAAVRAACEHHGGCSLPVRQVTVTTSGITGNTAEVVKAREMPPVELKEAA